MKICFVFLCLRISGENIIPHKWTVVGTLKQITNKRYMGKYNKEKEKI